MKAIFVSLTKEQDFQLCDLPTCSFGIVTHNSKGAVQDGEIVIRVRSEFFFLQTQTWATGNDCKEYRWRHPKKGEQLIIEF